MPRLPLRSRPLTASLFLAALCGWAGSAAAAVIQVDLSATPLTVPNTLDGIYLNLVTGATFTGSVPPPGYDFNPYNNGSGLAFFAPSAPSGQGTLASGQTGLALLGLETIGSGGIYQPGQALGTNFQVTGIHFVGLRFQNESTNALNYGWVELTTTGGAGAGFPATILRYAYEDTGAPIITPIPEPAGSLLLGLVGLAARRGRRDSPLI